MESMKSSPSRVCERGDGEPRAVSAQRSRQGAMQAVGYAAEATEADRAAEHSARHEARYTKLSNADGTAHCGRVGSRHF